MGSGVLPAAAPPLTLPDPAERGSTRLADRVLARIASRAAAEALTALRAPAEGDEGPRRWETPRASASQGRRGVRIRLGLDLPYPADVAAISRAVHRDVTERLAQLTGADAPRITLVVERLVPAAPTGGLR
jgi:uncharacterized alkaline shock family protein YloU